MSVGIMNRAARSRVLRFIALLVVSLGASAAALRADAQTAKHARVDLIAEQGAVVPGRWLWVGLRFQLEPGWHIYWKNPGDSGTPPKVQWILPPGFSAGTLLWPVPARLGMASIVDYGYEDHVLLMLPIQSPEELQSGSTATLSAKVNWVVCREICIPDEALVKLSLPVAENTHHRPLPWQALFATTRERLPRPAPRAWHIRAFAGKGRFTLEIETGVPQREATFFPLKEGQIDNAAAQQVAPLPRGLRINLKQSDQLLRPISVLRGVLVLDSGRAYEIAAPISPGG